MLIDFMLNDLPPGLDLVRGLGAVDLKPRELFDEPATDCGLIHGRKIITLPTQCKKNFQQIFLARTLFVGVICSGRSEQQEGGGKMKRSHLARAIAAEMELLSPRPTQRELERRTGISQASLSQYMLGHRRPDPPAVRKLATRWGNRDAGLRLLIAHLFDVVEEAGRPDEIEIRPKAQREEPVPEDIAQDLVFLRQEILRSPTTRETLRGMVRIMRSAR